MEKRKGQKTKSEKGEEVMNRVGDKFLILIFLFGMD
jgi:hypothetical protein